MDPASPHPLHELLLDFVRASGLLQPNHLVPGQQVSLSQVFALHELDGDVPLSQRDLAERLGLEKSSVSRMVADLERRELLVRERDPGDRRNYRLRLTGAGRALHARMADAFHSLFLRWAGEMDPAEHAALLTGLTALVRVIHREHASWHRPPDTDPGQSGGRHPY